MLIVGYCFGVRSERRLPFKIGSANGREAPESGRRLKA
jgi:hypothetical protein